MVSLCLGSKRKQKDWKFARSRTLLRDDDNQRQVEQRAAYDASTSNVFEGMKLHISLSELLPSDTNPNISPYHFPGLATLESLSPCT